MSTKIVISENKFNIPIGTYIHFSSYVDVPNTNNHNSYGTIWNTVSYWIYKDKNNNLVTIPDEIDFTKNHCKNVILLSNCKFSIEGEEYWKVFFNEEQASKKCHQLEFFDGKHYPAKLLKPYRDIVHKSTNLHSPFGQQRFKTIDEANEYSIKTKEYLY